MARFFFVKVDTLDPESWKQVNNLFVKKEISKTDAIAYFTEKGDEYKLELLEGLSDGSITFYSQGNFTDLCKGPHIPQTGFIKSVKLLSVAGAYWRGDEKRKQMTRISKPLPNASTLFLLIQG